MKPWRVGLLVERLSCEGADVYIGAVHRDDLPRLRFSWEAQAIGYCVIPIAQGTADACYLAFAADLFDATPDKQLAKGIGQRGRTAIRHSPASACGMLLVWTHADIAGRVIVGGPWEAWNRE